MPLGHKGDGAARLSNPYVVRCVLANTFLTPVTLWKDFDDSLPLEVMTLAERVEEGIVWRDVRFLGRQAGDRSRGFTADQQL